MNVVVASDPAEVGVHAAAIIRAGVDDGSIRVLGVATGSSPLPVYAALVADPPQRIRDVDLVALDEYVGLSAADPRSYRAFLERELVASLDLDPARLHTLDGMAVDAYAECLRYETAIDALGGVDLQILGIGSNGHIAFNEPGSAPDSRTRKALLTPQTRADNSRFFASPDEVPTHCLTQGLGTILAARRLVVVVSGIAKADALARAIAGPPDRAVPASFLHRHPDVTVIADPGAASRLALEGAPRS